jgi:hypothetical protein
MQLMQEISLLLTQTLIWVWEHFVYFEASYFQDPIQELLSQHQNIVGNKSNSVTTNLYTPASNNTSSLNANNILNSSHQSKSRQDSSSTTSSTTQIRSTPQTPLTREKSLNLKNSNSGGISNNNSHNIAYSGNTRGLIDSSVELDSTEMIENNNSKKVRPRSFWATWWKF